MRIGYMPYINSAVFYRCIPSDSGFEFVSLTPRKMANAIESGAIQAGPIPTVSAIRLEKITQPMQNLCIGVHAKAKSVLLFCKTPIQELNNQYIGVTSQTVTSFILLRILFAHFWHITPKAYLPLDDSRITAKLIIGDNALALRNSQHNYTYIYDLAEEWNKMTALPFIFAVWRARRDMDVRKVEEISKLIAYSTKQGINIIPKIALERASKSIPSSVIEDYLGGFFYKIATHQHLEAINTFKKFYTEINNLPK